MKKSRNTEAKELDCGTSTYGEENNWHAKSSMNGVRKGMQGELVNTATEMMGGKA